MTKTIKHLSLLLAAVMMFGLVGAGRPQEGGPKKHDGSLLNETLRDVINAGVKIFNEQQDYAGCYRMFQGSLLTVRPFVAKDLQAKIDAGIASAEKLPSMADRAFELRKVLDEIRASTKSGPPAEKKTEPKTEKKLDPKTEKKVEPKTEKKVDPPAIDKGQVLGKITYDGKPIAGYSVVFVGADKKKYSGAIQKDGSYEFKAPIPAGKYAIVFEPIADKGIKATPLPARYLAEGTSSLVVTIKAGPNQVDLNLVK